MRDYTERVLAYYAERASRTPDGYLPAAVAVGRLRPGEWLAAAFHRPPQAGSVDRMLWVAHSEPDGPDGTCWVRSLREDRTDALVGGYEGGFINCGKCPCLLVAVPGGGYGMTFQAEEAASSPSRDYKAELEALNACGRCGEHTSWSSRHIDFPADVPYHFECWEQVAAEQARAAAYAVIRVRPLTGLFGQGQQGGRRCSGQEA